MSRDIDTTLATEFEKPMLSPIFLMEFQYDSGTLRFWTGLGTKTIEGQNWTGSGQVISVSEVEESPTIEANGLAFVLSGVDAAILSISLTENYQGRKCFISLGALDSAGASVAPPLQIFAGYMDVMEINENERTCTITQTAEHKLSILNKAKTRRYTPEDQHNRFPGDKGLDFIPSLQDKEVIWGRKSAT